MNQLNEHAEGFNEIDNDLDYIIKKYKIEEQHYASFLKMKELLTKNSNLKLLKEEINKHKEGTQARLKAEKAYYKALEAIEKKAAYNAQRYKENVLKYGTAKQKDEILKTDKEILEKKKQNIFEEFAQKAALAESESINELERIQKIAAARYDYLNKVKGLQTQINNLNRMEASIAIKESDKQFDALRKSGNKLKKEFNAETLTGFANSIFNFDARAAKQSNEEALEALKKQKAQLRDNISLRNEQKEDISSEITRLQSIKEGLTSGQLNADSEEIKSLLKPVTDDNIENKEQTKALMVIDQSKDLTKKDNLPSNYNIIDDINAAINTLTTEQAELDAANRQDQKELMSVMIEEDKKNFEKLGMNIANAISDSYNKAFKQAEDFLTQNSAHINARLQGSDESFNKLTDKVTSVLSINPFVKTTDVLNSMKTAIDEGIVYNVEQRSFLNTISDKIANTFDAFNSNLTRLIKLQQADSTAARLGMEADLTRYFNSTFQDSSYLNNLFDSVSSTILEASSQLSRNQSAEFEYIVQKWMGALSSVGLSDETVNSIAQGINYLGTGNVQALAGNSQLQTLFAMAASKAGLEYSELLLNGLDSSNTNQLLQGLTTYLKEIVEGADNNIIKSAYGNILNLNLSDMTAINNLSSADISNITSKQMSYNSMLNSTNTQMASLILRTSLPEMLNNVYDNAMYSAASDMVNNPITWAMTKMLDYMEGNNIDFNIPSVMAAGFGIDLEASMVDLMKMGLGLTSAMQLAGNILQGLGSAGGMNLDSWGFEEYMSRGSGNGIGLQTTLGNTSSSQRRILNTNAQDVKTSTLNSATDEAENTKKITNKNQPEATKTLDDLMKAVVGTSATQFAVSRDININSSYLPDYQAISVIDKRLLRVNSSGGTGLDFLAVFDPTFNDSFQTVFGQFSVIEDKDKVKIYSSQIKTLTDDKRGLHVFQDEASNSKIKIISSKDDPISSKIINLEELRATLEHLPVKIENIEEFTKVLVTKLLGSDAASENSEGPLTKQLANAIANRTIKVESKDPTNGVSVTVKNMPMGYIT